MASARLCGKWSRAGYGRWAWRLTYPANLAILVTRGGSGVGARVGRARTRRRRALAGAYSFGLSGFERAECVVHEHGDCHRADPPGHGCNVRGFGRDGVELDIAD